MQDMLEIMQNADYGLYIEMYVWEAEPIMENIFYDIEFVQFMARIQRVATTPFYASVGQNGNA